MPVTPGGMNASFDVLLAFSLDEAANRRVREGASTMEQELKRLQEEAKGVGTEYEKSGDKVQKTSKETAQSLRAEARAIRAEVASMTSDVRNFQIGLLRDVSSSISSISQKALITGGAIVGGIFAEVQRYVSAAPDATRETRLWAAETERLGKARQRIDAVLLREALPLLRQAGRLANQAAGIVERHPEITSLALKAGTILAGVGVIGLAVSKGIKLVADVQYLATIPTQLTAAKLQDLAADKQLAAAQAQLRGAGGALPSGGGGIGRTIGNIGLIGGGLALASSIVLGTSKAFDTLSQKLIDMGGIARAVGQGIAVGNHGLLPLVKNVLGLGDASKQAGDSIEDAAGRIRGSANEAAIVEAFSSWKEDDARLIREAAENRKQIIADGEKQIADITRSYVNQRTEINRRASRAAAEITARFNEENARALEDLQRSRAETIEQGNERLRELEQSHQERLEEIRRNASDRVEEAERSRDALALVNAQRQLAEDESEENRSFRLEAQRARRETEQRLRDLDAQYELERQRRREQFEQDLAENAAQRAEQLQEAAAAHQEEIKQARESQAQKLRELQEGLNAERIRRREVMLEQIRDLDISLTGERALRQRKYNEMLLDAEAFFQQYRQAMPSGSAFSSVTGSSGTGTNETNKVAAIAGAIVAGITTQGMLPGSVTSAVYNDNRRMEAPLSKDARAAYEETAKRAIKQVLGVT